MTAPAHQQTTPAHPSATAYWPCIRPCFIWFSFYWSTDIKQDVSVSTYVWSFDGIQNDSRRKVRGNWKRKMRWTLVDSVFERKVCMFSPSNYVPWSPQNFYFDSYRSYHSWGLEKQGQVGQWGAMCGSSNECVSNRPTDTASYRVALSHLKSTGQFMMNSWALYSLN